MQHPEKIPQRDSEPCWQVAGQRIDGEFHEDWRRPAGESVTIGLMRRRIRFTIPMGRWTKGIGQIYNPSEVMSAVMASA
jgi:hypothetical protein